MNYLIGKTIFYIKISDIYQRVKYGGIICQDCAIKSCSKSL